MSEKNCNYCENYLNKYDSSPKLRTIGDYSFLEHSDGMIETILFLNSNSTDSRELYEMMKQFSKDKSPKDMLMSGGFCCFEVNPDLIKECIKECEEERQCQF